VDLITDFAQARPGDVICHSGETYIKAEAVADLLDQAERHGSTVLGLEGFLISERTVYPALSRVADFSGDSGPESIAHARALLAGPWALPPTPADQMHPAATGSHVITVVLTKPT
jgi:hypothetical protein